MFVDREPEMAALSALLDRPGAQFVVVYGRRRVGKPQRHDNPHRFDSIA